MPCWRCPAAPGRPGHSAGAGQPGILAGHEAVFAPERSRPWRGRPWTSSTGHPRPASTSRRRHVASPWRPGRRLPVRPRRPAGAGRATPTAAAGPGGLGLPGPATVLPLEDLGPADWKRALAAFIDPAPCASWPPSPWIHRARSRTDLLAALEEAAGRRPAPGLRWGLRDVSRVSLVPPHHWLLVRDASPFAASLSRDAGARARACALDPGRRRLHRRLPAGRTAAARRR